MNSGKVNGEGPELRVLAERFELHNGSDGKSPKTVQWYNQALGIFTGWLAQDGMSTCLEDIGEDEVRLFILHLQERKGLWGVDSSHTVNIRVRSLRAFFNWLNRKGHTESHRLEDVKPPKVRKREIEILTDEEIESIFAAINPNTAMGARSGAIFSLMLDAGLRLSEVVTLKYRDVHLDGQYVKILGEGNKERVVAFGSNCRRALANYAQHHRFENKNKDERPGTFFLSRFGTAMSPDALRSLTERLSKSAGVPRLHPHLMRHTYATRFLLNGRNVFLLQQNLGHTTLEIFRRYVHIANRMAALVSQDFSPLDRFEMKGAWGLRHRFNGDGWQGQIYPNAGGPPQGKTKVKCAREGR